MTNASDAQEQILAVSRARNRGMLDRDVALVDEVLADEYTAVHIGGYEQPKQEWLQQVASGRMQYHSITEVDSSIDVNGDTAVAVTTNLVDATIDGSRSTWRLRSTTDYERHDGQWKAVRSRTTTA